MQVTPGGHLLGKIFAPGFPLRYSLCGQNLPSPECYARSFKAVLCGWIRSSASHQGKDAPAPSARHPGFLNDGLGASSRLSAAPAYCTTDHRLSISQLRHSEQFFCDPVILASRGVLLFHPRIHLKCSGLPRRSTAKEGQQKIARASVHLEELARLAA